MSKLSRIIEKPARHDLSGVAELAVTRRWCWGGEESRFPALVFLGPCALASLSTFGGFPQPKAVQAKQRSFQAIEMGGFLKACARA
jgi:hypothetical protein